jgi:hypothetical protein
MATKVMVSHPNGMMPHLAMVGMQHHWGAPHQDAFTPLDAATAWGKVAAMTTAAAEVVEGAK